MQLQQRLRVHPSAPVPAAPSAQQWPWRRQQQRSTRRHSRLVAAASASPQQLPLWMPCLCRRARASAARRHRRSARAGMILKVRQWQRRRRRGWRAAAAGGAAVPLPLMSLPLTRRRRLAMRTARGQLATALRTLCASARGVQPRKQRCSARRTMPLMTRRQQRRRQQQAAPFWQPPSRRWQPLCSPLVQAAQQPAAVQRLLVPLLRRAGGASLQLWRRLPQVCRAENACGVAAWDGVQLAGLLLLLLLSAS